MLVAQQTVGWRQRQRRRAAAQPACSRRHSAGRSSALAAPSAAESSALHSERRLAVPEHHVVPKRPASAHEACSSERDAASACQYEHQCCSTGTTPPLAALLLAALRPLTVGAVSGAAAERAAVAAVEVHCAPCTSSMPPPVDEARPTRKALGRSWSSRCCSSVLVVACSHNPTTVTSHCASSGAASTERQASPGKTLARLATAERWRTCRSAREALPKSRPRYRAAEK